MVSHGYSLKRMFAGSQSVIYGHPDRHAVENVVWQVWPRRRQLQDVYNIYFVLTTNTNTPLIPDGIFFSVPKDVERNELT